MALPALAPIPPAEIRLSIAPEEWEVCLQTWLDLVDLYLRLPTSKEFVAAIKRQSPIDFLKSFYREAAFTGSGQVFLTGPTAQKLRKACNRMTYRISSETNAAETLLNFDFISNFCQLNGRSSFLSNFMDRLWKERGDHLRRILQEEKSTALGSIEMSSDLPLCADLTEVTYILSASSDAAALFMTGSDFLDALAMRFAKTQHHLLLKVMTAIAYIGLISLTKIQPPNVSLLTDQLFSLKTQADSTAKSASLLADLVTNTGLSSKLQRSISDSGHDRLRKLLSTLETYRSPSISRPRKSAGRKTDKGKEKLRQSYGEMHVHSMSLVTQVQDLFPDLGSGFILKLLDEYDDCVEQVTAHLLDETLPSHLQHADRTKQAPMYDNDRETDLEHFVPSSTPPPSESFVPARRNVFDDDEMDRLEVDASRLHLGKKTDHTSSNQPNKAAILSALAAFDSDDDERDDTYDAEDVGGTVDTAHPDGELGPSAKITREENDMALFTAYKSSPQAFGRETAIRRSQPRQALKTETGMTDEAIEGWAIMLQHDPRRLKQLEARCSGFDDQQRDLARTAYKESPAGTETEDSDTPPQRGAFRGESRGRGRGGRGGGNAAGPSSDPNTAAAQRRNEANKGSRANHNRRNQRAKKMARGGFAG